MSLPLIKKVLHKNKKLTGPKRLILVFSVVYYAVVLYTPMSCFFLIEFLTKLVFTYNKPFLSSKGC